MTKTDIATLRRILAALQSRDPDYALAGMLVARLLVRHDKAYVGTKIAGVTKGDTR